MKISSKEADKLISGKWFSGYTKEVEVLDDQVMDNFDAELRTKTGDEFIIFRGSLTVNGPMRLGSDVHSIYVVDGDLKAESIDLGDAVLVVKGKVRAKKYIHTPQNEGIFEVGGKQIPPKLDSIKTPEFIWYNPTTGEFETYKDL